MGLAIAPALALLLATPDEPVRGVIADAAQIGAEWLADRKAAGTNTVALRIEDDRSLPALRAAAQRIRAAGFALAYWIEIARNQKLALEHPRWMSSLPDDGAWRRLFGDAPKLTEGEVVKCFPWVPILYAEAFHAQAERVVALLARLPPPASVYLNDLQSGPSACGCGNALCRWSTDQGPVETGKRLGPEAALTFLTTIEQAAPGVQVIPVWTGECEEHDPGCGETRGCPAHCLEEWLLQTAPVVAHAPRVAVLLAHAALGKPESWIARTLDAFAAEPEKNGADLPSTRTIAVLDGADATPAQIAARVKQARFAHGGYLVAMIPIEQGFEPRVVAVK
jgi:hypothetical protein